MADLETRDAWFDRIDHVDLTMLELVELAEERAAVEYREERVERRPPVVERYEVKVVASREWTFGGSLAAFAVVVMLLLLLSVMFLGADVTSDLVRDMGRGMGTVLGQLPAAAGNVQQGLHS